MGFQDKIDNLYNYSTVEQVIGTWIDGKPLYRKTISKSISSADTDNFFVDDVVGKDIKNVYGYLRNHADSTRIQLGAYLNSAYYSGWYIATSDSSLNLLIFYGRAYIGGYCELTIEYTKTTD